MAAQLPLPRENDELRKEGPDRLWPQNEAELGELWNDGSC